MFFHPRAVHVSCAPFVIVRSPEGRHTPHEPRVAPLVHRLHATRVEAVLAGKILRLSVVLLLLVASSALAMTSGRLRAPSTKKQKTAARPTVLSDAIAKPRGDAKAYRLVRLPNDMRVLLISDPSITAAESDKESDDHSGSDDESNDGEEGF